MVAIRVTKLLFVFCINCLDLLLSKTGDLTSRLHIQYSCKVSGSVSVGVLLGRRTLQLLWQPSGAILLAKLSVWNSSAARPAFRDRQTPS